jgi:hypothetical protein
MEVVEVKDDKEAKEVEDEDTECGDSVCESRFAR